MGYTEVYTPSLVESPAMEQHLEALSVDNYWFHTSPEFSMKKLLASGMCRIYQISPCYRKEEVGRFHSLEFRMLEWYRVGASMWDIMKEIEDLFAFLFTFLNKPTPKFSYYPTEEFLPIDLHPDEWFYRWVDEIEPILPEACILYDYPAWQSALARKRGQYASRFEVYYKGVELANAIDEEGNSSNVHMRWLKNNSNRIRLGKHPHPIDKNFLSALDSMPRCSGIALGLDRLLMLLLDATCIQQIQSPKWSSHETTR